MSGGEEGLRAGAASASIAPPPGMDLMGYLKRWQPSEGVGEPCEATALVLDDGARRVALVGIDYTWTRGDWGRRMRAAVARAAGCAVEAVLLNSSHTHAMPLAPGLRKAGGELAERPEEIAYAESLVERVAAVAGEAAARLAPAAVAAARGRCELNVNRRQRSGGTTIIGWNPEEACDHDVDVLRVDAADRRALATVVAYAAHPVVVGPKVQEASSDFVGPLRERVRAWTGGECLFLQGCAGNVMPLEALFDRTGPERRFGEGIALAALEARERAEAVPTAPRQVPFMSAVPFALWRRQPVSVQEGAPTAPRLAAAELEVRLPLKQPPSREEMAALAAELEARVERLRAEGRPREEWNPSLFHADWARAMVARIDASSAGEEVTTAVQRIAIGGIELIGLPCEPFCELGLELKERSQADFTFALGYTNDVVGYVATAREHPFGGYEPTLAQRHYDQAAPFAPEAAALLVEAALELSRRGRGADQLGAGSRIDSGGGEGAPAAAEGSVAR
ncbi:hypothetical protein [Conexibacter arvalis]|uniref:Neutral/alkaline non-lysosomal ceramidase N-terminal domain-containing protein n=1 Tax=Conexibacter arvalis TaxID=912552 RepID=A0A840ILM9_9ACTN|nr:hypothetical protein [Conexibacter arvalis]MBB4664848.1 hypothetical protein [Conexibacter arvalis]